MSELTCNTQLFARASVEKSLPSGARFWSVHAGPYLQLSKLEDLLLSHEWHFAISEHAPVVLRESSQTWVDPGCRTCGSHVEQSGLALVSEAELECGERSSGLESGNFDSQLLFLSSLSTVVLGIQFHSGKKV